MSVWAKHLHAMLFQALYISRIQDVGPQVVVTPPPSDTVRTMNEKGIHRLRRTSPCSNACSSMIRGNSGLCSKSTRYIAFPSVESAFIASSDRCMELTDTKVSRNSPWLFIFRCSSDGEGARGSPSNSHILIFSRSAPVWNDLECLLTAGITTCVHETLEQAAERPGNEGVTWASNNSGIATGHCFDQALWLMEQEASNARYLTQKSPTLEYDWKPMAGPCIMHNTWTVSSQFSISEHSS